MSHEEFEALGRSLQETYQFTLADQDLDEMLRLTKLLDAHEPTEGAQPLFREQPDYCAESLGIPRMRFSAARYVEAWLEASPEERDEMDRDQDARVQQLNRKMEHDMLHMFDPRFDK